MEIRSKSTWYKSSNQASHGTSLNSLAQDTLLARPVAVKAIREHSEKESAESEQQYFRSIKDFKLKAGETVPGATGSALRRAQGDLGWAPGRKMRWFERRKLGIDRPLTWEEV